MINSIWTNKSFRAITMETSNNTTLTTKGLTTRLEYQASMSISCQLVRTNTAKKTTVMNAKTLDLTKMINKHTRNSFLQQNKSSKQSALSVNTLKTTRECRGLTRSLKQTTKLFSKTLWRNLNMLLILLLSGNGRRKSVHHQMSQ
jgi:hypothetical protein